jgi:hypothetical protein
MPAHRLVERGQVHINGRLDVDGAEEAGKVEGFYASGGQTRSKMAIRRRDGEDWKLAIPGAFGQPVHGHDLFRRGDLHAGCFRMSEGLAGANRSVEGRRGRDRVGRRGHERDFLGFKFLF